MKMEHCIVGKEIHLELLSVCSFLVVDQWLINKRIHFMVNFGFLLTEVVKEFSFCKRNK
jgi:hypothetical protein